MIRKLTADDRAQFLAMAAAFYQSSAVAHAIPASHHARTFAELMASDVYAACYIIEHAAQVAGYLLLSKTFSQEAGGMVVWVEEIYILPEFQGQGLGSACFAFLQEHMPCARVRLEISPENERAKALYQKMGFVELPYMQMVKDYLDE